MSISPGSLPIHGIFSPRSRRRPINIIKTPRRIRSFPREPKPNICSSPTQVQLSKSLPSPERRRAGRQSAKECSPSLPPSPRRGEGKDEGFSDFGYWLLKLIWDSVFVTWCFLRSSRSAKIFLSHYKYIHNIVDDTVPSL